VRVSAKITAWYAASAPAQSGYQVVPSNGRLESDLLDRLAEALGSGETHSSSPSAASQPQPAKTKSSNRTPTASSSISTAGVPDAPSTAKSDQAFRAGAPPDNETPSMATQRAVADRHLEALRIEAKNLEEIQNNQSHPTNLVAVKKAGTPIFATPNEGGKVLFLAADEDEFEMLDMNTSWVHVRISGLSRGWILRSGIETNGDSLPDAAQVTAPPSPPPASAPAKTAVLVRFQVEHEEIASFPASWEPLRGKTVKIISVQPATPTSSDSQAKLNFAKSLFEKEYAELTQAQSTAAGVVVVFDSADGGMLATTLPNLRQWKEGTLSDEALWRRCYVDPPEMISGARTQ